MKRNRLIKILLLVGLVVSSFSLSAQVKVGADGIQPNNLSDINSTFLPQYGKASWYSVVDIAARNAISTLRRDTGMIVHVRSVDSLYQLKGGISNANWTTNITMPVTAASITIGAINGQPKVANGATILAGVFYNQTVDGTNPGLLASADYLDFQSKNKGIQFKNQGVSIGTIGAIDTLDFVGTGITASVSGHKISVTVTGADTAKGIVSINGDTSSNQSFSVDSFGTKPNWVNVPGNHTINIPYVGAVDSGIVTPLLYNRWNAKIGPADTAAMLSVYLRKFDTTAMLATYPRFQTSAATRITYWKDSRTITGSPDYTFDSTNKRVLLNGELNVTGTFGSGADMILAGAGTKMFFYPKKAAFRAGSVDGTQWNKDSLGNYSSGFGFDTKVLGDYSFSAGTQNTVYGLYSAVIGNSNTSSGNSDVILGTQNVVTADNSFAAGISNTISSTGSAIGTGIKINQLNKVAVGKWNDSTTTARKSFAVGWGTADNARLDLFYLDTLGTAFFKPGNTAARPSAPVFGMIRANTDSTAFEYYTGSTWLKFGATGKFNLLNVGAGVQQAYTNLAGDSIFAKRANPVAPILISTNTDSSLRVALDTSAIHTSAYNDARYLQTVDTSNITNFSTKVRSTITGVSPISFVQATGVISLQTVTVPFGGTGQTTYNKGDLLVGVNSTTLTKLGVGSNGNILMADATQASGVKWAPLPNTTLKVANVGPLGSTLSGYVTIAGDSLYLENFKPSTEIAPLKNSDSTISFSLATTGVGPAGSCIGCDISYDTKGRITAASSGITGTNGKLLYKTASGAFTAPIINDSTNGRIEFDKYLFFPAFATTGSLFDISTVITGKNRFTSLAGTATSFYIPLQVSVTAPNGVYNTLLNAYNLGANVGHLNGMSGELIEVNQDSADAFTSYFNISNALNNRGFTTGLTAHFGKSAEYAIAYNPSTSIPNFYSSTLLLGIDSTGQVRLPKISQLGVIDTLNNKVVVVDAGGNLHKMSWPASGGAGCANCIPYTDTVATIATQNYVLNHTNGNLVNLDFIIGDGQPTTPLNGTNVYTDTTIKNKLIVSFSQEGIQMPLTPRPGSVYATYNAAAGTITLSEGTFATNTYYKILYRDTAHGTQAGALDGFMAARDTIHQVSHGFTVGKVVYFNGTVWALADTIVANSYPVSGVVSKAINADYFEVTHAGKMTWTGHGLSLGSPQYLTVNGNTTAVAPQTTIPIMYAIDANTVVVQVLRGNNGMGIGGGSGGGNTYIADENTLHLNSGTSTFSIKTTYSGQVSINTLGTITQGTWHATPIETTYGGVPAGGTTGQVLTKINGSNYNYSWQPAPSGFADPLTTAGDIIAKIGGLTTRLPQGADGTFLGVQSGVLGYYTPPGGGSQTLQQTLTVGSVLTQNNTISNGTNTTTWSGTGRTIFGAATGVGAGLVEFLSTTQPQHIDAYNASTYTTLQTNSSGYYNVVPSGGLMIVTGGIQAPVYGYSLGSISTPYVTASINVPLFNHRTFTGTANTVTDDYRLGYIGSSGGGTINLGTPSSYTNHYLIIQDEGGNCSGANVLTIAGTVNGSSNPTIATAFGVIRLYSNGSAWMTW